MPVTPLASWDAKRRAQYTAQRFCPIIHLLIDASGSMYPHQEILLTCYTRYLRHLQQIAAPGTQIDQRCFSGTLHSGAPELLVTAQPMTYEPGGGTRLYSALSSLVSPQADGDHLLVIFTDGLTEEPETDAQKLQAFFAKHPGWLPVFLGAFPQALSVGFLLGIAEGNCLCFGAHALPEAFATLTAGTEKYLTGKPADRKLLAQTGLLR